jgi:diguanylate cyclase (GGDEF)-like protein
MVTALICAVETVTLVSAVNVTDLSSFIHYWSSALFLSLPALPGAFWLVYLDYKILRKKGNYKRRYIIYFMPTIYFFIDCFIVNTLVAKGSVFTVDEMNVYARGDSLWMHIVVMYVVLLFSVANFYRSSNMIKGRITQVVLVIVTVPIIGNVIQMFFYGVTVSMPSYVLAAFAVYLILEKDEMQRDNLTNLYTRSYLENRIIHKLSTKEFFSLIMIDLNDFKEINDTYGHHTGDEALKKVADLLVENVGVEDEVCRFGGDEFLVIIEDTRNIGEVQIKLFEDKFKELNRMNQKYEIKMSYGLVYVDYKEKYSVYELLKMVDTKMYEDKKKRKEYI